MTLTSQVLQILRGPVVRRIRFIFPAPGGNVTIAPQTFHLVASAIESGRVHVARPTDLDADTGAQYNPVARTRLDGTQVRANTLEINSASGRLHESEVLHESLHAAYDLLRTGITAIDEEASAYVVSSLYSRMTGLRPALWNTERRAAAGTVADTLLAQYARGTAGIPTVGATEWNALRLIVTNSPMYMFSATASYRHDG